MTTVKYDNDASARYEYEYAANGAAALVKDNNLNRVTTVEHDLANRPIRASQRDADGNLKYRTTLDYDTCHIEGCTHSSSAHCESNAKNNLTQFAERVATANGFTDYKTNYAYDKDDRIKQVQYGDTAHKVAYNYDSMGRISKRTVTNGSASCVSSYEYAPGGYGSSTVNSTSPLISKITQPGISFEYTYDELGNIVSEKRGDLTTTYHYDSLGQLVQVNDPHENATWAYSYDRGGNIIQKTRHALANPESVIGPVLETITYSYGDSNWKDKLTAFNGQTITYDAIGNPLNDGTWTYTWTAGRQLAQMSKTGMTVQFKYNHDGLRTQKIVTENGVTTTTEYTYHGTLLTHMKKGFDELHFFYDADNTPAMVEWNGAKYHYLYNQMGDAIGMIDSNGTAVVEYKYDAWGRSLGVNRSLAATLGTLNPFRYRGYVWDEETQFYYLRSRYYSSKWGRFNNADSVLVGDKTTPFCLNGFIYCSNNPILFEDQAGKLWSIVGAIAGAVIGAVAGALISHEETGEINWWAVAGSAVAGALIGAGIGFIADKLAAKIAVQTLTGVEIRSGEQIYYHVTSNEAAQKIIADGVIKSGEFGKVYVLNFQPTLSQAKMLGARSIETVIRFVGNSTRFTRDDTVTLGAGVYFSEVNGLDLIIKNIEKVGFLK